MRARFYFRRLDFIRLPEGREEVENGDPSEGSRALCLSQSGSEPLPNPMLTQSAAEVSLVGSELVTGWLAWFPLLRKFTPTLVLPDFQCFSIPICSTCSILVQIFIELIFCLKGKFVTWQAMATTLRKRVNRERRAASGFGHLLNGERGPMRG